MPVTKSTPQGAQTTDKAVTEAPKAVPPAEPAEAPEVRLELRRIKRYFFGNTLYVEGVVYVFSEGDARYMLSLEDQGLPVFTLARPRVKTVQVPVEQPVRRQKAPDRVVSDLVEFVQSQHKQAPQPKQVIELGEDDPETKARLLALDNDETDTAGAVTV